MQAPLSLSIRMKLLEWNEKTGKWKRNRERIEFVRKMKDRFGFKVTWKKPE